MTRAPNEDGFTLVEVMVATFITALLSVIGLGLLNGALTGKARAAEITAQVEELELTRAVLRRDLGQIVPRRSRDAFGLESSAVFYGNAGSDDTELMAFITRTQDGVGAFEGRSRLVHVRWLLRQGELIRETRAAVDAAPDSPVNARVMMSGLEDVRARFKAVGDWRNEWGRLDPASLSSLPFGVEITLDHPRYGPLVMMFATGEVE